MGSSTTTESYSKSALHHKAPSARMGLCSPRTKKVLRRHRLHQPPHRATRRGRTHRARPLRYPIPRRHLHRALLQTCPGQTWRASLQGSGFAQALHRGRLGSANGRANQTEPRLFSRSYRGSQPAHRARLSLRRLTLLKLPGLLFCFPGGKGLTHIGDFLNKRYIYLEKNAITGAPRLPAKVVHHKTAAPHEFNNVGEERCVIVVLDQ